MEKGLESRRAEDRSKEIARDTEHYSHPDRWVSWPYLPLVRKGQDGFSEIGFCVDLPMPSGKVRVFLGNMFDAATLRDMAAMQTLDYETVRAMFADGWKVD